MKTLTHKTAFALLVALTAVALAASVEAASPSKTLYLAPGGPGGPGFSLPKFGFSSFNIHGYGERVTSVNWNGRAAQLGLEPGDVLLALNGYPLTYHGSWNDALAEAVYNGGGWIQLKIRDVRTGLIRYRETFVDCGYGPVTHKYQVNYGVGPNTPHVVHHHGNHYGNGKNTVKNIAELIKAFKD